MEIKKVGSRGTLFTFYDLSMPTTVYVINGKNKVYIIDTYLGPDIMESINQYIKEEYGHKEFIIINTHNHWDHVWGNSIYSSNMIISHELCKKYMEQDGEEALEKHKELKKGNVVLTYPNVTFTDKIYFEEDKILIYHTPGHTDDSISVLDMEDKVLFAGDNLESPKPYVDTKDLEKYIKTLEEHLNLDVNFVIGGHTDCEDKGLIHHNLDYAKKELIENKVEN